jgi:hypothetical protein
LRAEYAREARDFVEPLFRSEVVASAHQLAGVVAVDVDRLYTGSSPGLADRLLARRPTVGPGGTALPASLLKLDTAPFDWLEPMT